MAGMVGSTGQQCSGVAQGGEKRRARVLQGVEAANATAAWLPRAGAQRPGTRRSPGGRSGRSDARATGNDAGQVPSSLRRGNVQIFEKRRQALALSEMGSRRNELAQRIQPRRGDLRIFRGGLPRSPTTAKWLCGQIWPGRKARIPAQPRVAWTGLRPTRDTTVAPGGRTPPAWPGYRCLHGFAA